MRVRPPDPLDPPPHDPTTAPSSRPASTSSAPPHPPPPPTAAECRRLEGPSHLLFRTLMGGSVCASPAWIGFSTISSSWSYHGTKWSLINGIAVWDYDLRGSTIKFMDFHSPLIWL
ncbi:unnamed protein product [Urochloa humidicola]